MLVIAEDVNLTLMNNHVLKNISLKLNEGDRCVMIGINGSGKSCLLRTLSGKHLISEGKLFINGKDMTVFQNNCDCIAFLGDNWSRTVAFNGYSVAYSADIKVKNMMKNLQEKYKERREELIKVLGINPEWRMHLVSSGQRRRVKLFLGLLKPFKVALIDEMTMDLDIITRVNFMKWLKDESIKKKCCIIYATHIFDGLSDWPTHIAHINSGKCNVEKYSGQEITKFAYSILSNDYKGLEKEDGIGVFEENNMTNPLLGKQGGYSSGRITKSCLE